MKYTISSAVTLSDFLKSKYPDSANKTIKQLLENGRVILNGRTAKVGKLPLKPGYVVEIKKKEPRPVNPALKIVHEDDVIIVIEKKEGLLTIASEAEPEKNAYSYLYDYVRGESPDNKIFIVHRLDGKTSGLIVFARSKEVRDNLRAQFAAHKVERRYIAIVEGKMKKSEGTLKNFLVEDKNYKVHPTGDKDKGEFAVTHYKVIKEKGDTSVLDVSIETGKKAQIRVQLSTIGHPVIGDLRYGAKTDPIGRLGLHAYKLSFIHPGTEKKVEFGLKIPDSFDIKQTI